MPDFAMCKLSRLWVEGTIPLRLYASVHESREDRIGKLTCSEINECG